MTDKERRNLFGLWLNVNAPDPVQREEARFLMPYLQEWRSNNTLRLHIVNALTRYIEELPNEIIEDQFYADSLQERYDRVGEQVSRNILEALLPTVEEAISREIEKRLRYLPTPSVATAHGSSAVNQEPSLVISVPDDFEGLDDEQMEMLSGFFST